MLESLIDELQRWAAARQASGLLRSPERGHDVYAASDLLMLLYTIGRLDLSPAERSLWAQAINRHQDPETGLYRSDGHHGQFHATAFAVAGLELIGARPAHPLRAMEALLPWQALAPWLLSRDWENPWGGAGHDVPALLSTCINLDLADSAWFQPVFDWLDAEQDPATGMWRRRQAPPDHQDLGCAFHFYFVYEHLRRPILRADAIIDTTLALQQAGGSWSRWPWPAGYIDLDAVYVLNRMTRLRPERRAEVRPALERCLAFTLANLADPALRERLLDDTHACLGTVAALQALQEGLPDRLVTRPLLRGVLDRRPFI